MTVLFVALGAAVGAPLRYLVDRAVHNRWAPGVPWGTFVANVAGSFGLGLLAGADGLPDAVAALLGPGLCGALSTYSTFGYELVGLIEQDRPGAALTYATASLAVGLGAAWAGLAVAGCC